MEPRACHPHLKTLFNQRTAQVKLSVLTYNFLNDHRNVILTSAQASVYLPVSIGQRHADFQGKAMSTDRVVAVREVSMNLPSPSSPVTSPVSSLLTLALPTLQLSLPPALPQGEDHLSSSSFSSCSPCTGSPFLQCPLSPPHLTPL